MIHDTQHQMMYKNIESRVIVLFYWMNIDHNEHGNWFQRQQYSQLNEYLHDIQCHMVNKTSREIEHGSLFERGKYLSLKHPQDDLSVKNLKD